MNNLFFGIVEDRNDDLKLGRCKVRIVGLHSPNKEELPTYDLPWAYPLQPITSAGISGVGWAPIGLVEGSWVAIVFRDQDFQIPIIVGSVGGIPNDSVDQIVIDTPQQIVHKTVNQIKSYTEKCPEIIKLFDVFKPNAVDDGTGKFIIGFRSYKVSGKDVVIGLSITREIAEQELKAELDSLVGQVRSKIRAPITQSILDALVSFAHEIGIDKFSSSSVLSEVNIGRYEVAAANLSTYEVSPKRRGVEKQLFESEPYPVPDTQLPSERYNGQLIDPSNAFAAPSGEYPKYKNEPDTNKLARNSDISSTIVAFKEAARVKGVPTAGPEGFTWDQSPTPYAAQYPMNKVFASESGHLLEFDDTEGCERVHLYHKAGTFTEVDANGTQVNRIVGDSFEILERNGFVYIRGTSNVTVDGAHTLKVSGVMNVDVDGAANINIYNNANVNVSGSANISVGQETNIMSPTIKLECDDFHLNASNSINIQAPTINTKSTSSIFIEAASDVNIKSGANTFLDSSGSCNIFGNSTAIAGESTIQLKTSGALNVAYTSGSFGSSASSPQRASGAGEADATGLNAPDAARSANSPEFSSLEVTQRFNDAETLPETLEDESENPNYKTSALNSGILGEDDVSNLRGEEVMDNKQVGKNTLTPAPADCDILFGMKDIPMTTKLSKYFTLKDMTANGTRPLRPQNGLTIQQIACNLKCVCTYLDVIKDTYPNITINSGWRRPGDAPGSSTKSQHNTGQAVDIGFKGFTIKQVWEAAHKIAEIVPYDQLILEYKGKSVVWIHFSVTYTGNRKQAFTMKNGSRNGMAFGKFYLLDGSQVAKSYTPKFDYAIPKTLEHEGGYVNNKNDSGGETNFGITKRSYPRLDIRNLTKNDAIAIYYRDFWAKFQYLEQLELAIAAKTFDAGVNMGPSQARKLLKRAGNKMGLSLNENTPIDSSDVNSLNSLDQSALLTTFRETIADFYKDLVRRKPKNSQFLKGWLRRAYS